MFTRGSTRITMWGARPIEYNGPWDMLYSYCRENVAENIAIGKKDPTELPPESRYADAPGVRLVPLHYCVKNDDPKLHYDRNNEFDRGVGVYRDGYIWCGTSYTKEPGCKIRLNPEGAQWGSEKHAISSVTHLETIRLKYANFVYVVDDAVYEAAVEKGLEEAFYERAKTMVPIDEYDGSYKTPFVIISRDLLFDEIVSVQRIEAVL